MKAALVHDYLTEYGGAERVLEAIHEIWPSAPVFTSIYDKSILLHSDVLLSESAAATGWDIRPSRISELPLAGKLAKTFTFVMPLVFENMDLREYDVVISDGTIWSKGVLTTPGQLHIFYCHTPPRFLYGYPGETDRRRLWYLQPILKPLDNWLRVWDFESAQRPDFIIANSETVAARIRKFWRRDSEVIYPPVGLGAADSPTLRVDDKTLRVSLGGAGEGFFLVVGRLSAYKNIDLAIKACNQLDIPLVVVGTGREEERLKKIVRTGKNVKFINFVEDRELSKLYKDCRALIFPVSDEDFGIVPVEAMSFGKPVIALRSGGVTETVVGGKTGVFFGQPTVESLVNALLRFEEGLKGIKGIKENCIEQASKFSKERFQKEFKEFVENKWREGFKG